MAKIRLLPPAGGDKGTQGSAAVLGIAAGSPTVSAQQGEPRDLGADALHHPHLEHWLKLGELGSTAERPALIEGKNRGYRFFDTDLDTMIWWDGLNWRRWTGELADLPAADAA